MSVNCLIDSYFYGKFVLTAYNFLSYNVFHNVGAHYGTHPWHWFVTEGFPVLLFGHLPLFLAGLKFNKQLQFPLTVIVFNIFCYRLKLQILIL
jgi:phosphatidylinositol glycan class B